MAGNIPHSLAAYAGGALAGALGLWLIWTLQSTMGPTIMPLLLVAVLASAWFGGMGPGLLATLVSAVGLYYFFLSAPQVWNTSAHVFISLVLFVSLSALICYLIDARRRAVKALHASEARLWAVLATSQDGQVVVGQDGRIVFANAAAGRLFGFARQELLGRPVETLVPEHLREAHSRHRAQYYLAPYVRSMGVGLEMFGRRKDGSEFPVEVSLGPITVQAKTLIAAAIRDVSDQKQAELDLRRSELQLAEAQRMAHIGSWEWDIREARLRWSDEMFRIFGVAPQVCVPDYQFVMARVHPDDREFVRTTMLEALRLGESCEGDYRVVHPDGELRVLHGKGEVIRDQAGRPVRMLGTCQDITGRKHDEDVRRFLDEVSAVLLSNFDYEVTLEKLARLSVPTLADWCVIDVTLDGEGVQRVATAHADPRKDELARQLRRFPPDLTLEQGVSRALRSGEPNLRTEASEDILSAAVQNAEHLALVQELGVRSAMTVPLVAHGAILGAITLVAAESGRRFDPSDLAVAQDLAQRAAFALDNARLYREAQSQQQRLLTVLDQIPEGVIIVEARSGHIILKNRAAQDIHPEPKVGWKIDASWPLPAARHLDGRPYDDHEFPLRRALGGETLLAEEMMVERQDGSNLVIQISAAPVRNEDQSISAAVAVYQDITQRKSLEQLKDDFLSLSAHELKTPLTAIKGINQLLLRTAKQSRTLGEAELLLLRTAAERADYVSSLIDELLDLSRVASGRLLLHLEPVDLGELLREVVVQQQFLHPTYSINVEGAEQPLWGTWDRGRLEQVFTSLLDNAVKYSPPLHPIKVAVCRTDDEAEVTVQDRGIGIPARDLRHLFERHYRASNVGKAQTGLGLGLYLSGQVVERLGGTVWVESREGVGSTFHVKLPIAERGQMAA